MISTYPSVLASNILTSVPAVPLYGTGYCHFKLVAHRLIKGGRELFDIHTVGSLGNEGTITKMFSKVIAQIHKPQNFFLLGGGPCNQHHEDW